MLPDCCPVCPVCNVGVHCVQMVGWIKMKLGTAVGLDPGNIVLYLAPSPKKGLCLLWPNGWTDQDATWYEGRPRPWPHCVRRGPSPRKGYNPLLLFSAHVYCGQTVAHLSYC